MSDQRTITVERSRESSERFDSWQPYAEYIYENTNLSQRQAEVVALKRFGHDRQACADALGVKPNTVDNHVENANQKQERSRFERDLFGTDVRDDFAPVLLRRVVAADEDGDANRAEVRLYANHAADGAFDSAPQYLLIEEVQDSGASARVVRSERRASYYDSWDELVYAGFVTRVFPTQEVVTLAEVALAVFSTREEIAATRRDVYPDLEAEYERIREGTADVVEVAQMYGLPVDLVEANVAALSAG